MNFDEFLAGKGAACWLLSRGIRQSVIDRWNQRRVKAGLTAWDPDTVYHLRGRLAGDTGDRMAAGPAGPGAHRRLRRPLTAASAAKVSINRDTVGS
jgi:hypothetical protein